MLLTVGRPSPASSRVSGTRMRTSWWSREYARKSGGWSDESTKPCGLGEDARNADLFVNELGVVDPHRGNQAGSDICDSPSRHPSRRRLENALAEARVGCASFTTVPSARATQRTGSSEQSSPCAGACPRRVLGVEVTRLLPLASSARRDRDGIVACAGVKLGVVEDLRTSRRSWEDPSPRCTAPGRAVDPAVGAIVPAVAEECAGGMDRRAVGDTDRTLIVEWVSLVASWTRVEAAVDASHPAKGRAPALSSGDSNASVGDVDPEAIGAGCRVRALTSPGRTVFSAAAIGPRNRSDSRGPSRARIRCCRYRCR